MPVGVISDIHSNKEALEKALEILLPKVDKIYILGDIVGYGENPQECIDIIKEISNRKKVFIVQGNHDRCFIELIKEKKEGENLEKVVDKFIKKGWNPLAIILLLDQMKKVNEEGIEFLMKFENSKKLLVNKNTLLFHGSILGDVDNYIMEEGRALANIEAALLDYPNLKYIFYGHTHIPIIFGYKNKAIKPIEILVHPEDLFKSFEKEQDYYTFKLSKSFKTFLINPGSVGEDRMGLLTCGILYLGRRFEYYKIKCVKDRKKDENNDFFL